MNGIAGADRRMPWVDTARGLGIALVFAGHFLQDAAPRNAVAADAFQFLYAFHVPFFFLLSGCVTSLGRSYGAYLKTLFLRLIIPVLFFGLGFAALDVLLELRHGHVDTVSLESEAENYLIGHPDFDWVTWFLVCLFVCESMAYWVAKVLTGITAQLLGGLLFIVVGAYVGNHSRDPHDGDLYFIARFWFLSEAVAAMGFFFIGRAVSGALRARAWRPRLAPALAIGGLLLVLLTYRQNVDGRGTVVVMMAARNHGNVFWFAGTALAGGFALVGLGYLLRDSRLLALVGRNTLPLLGLNGLFFHRLNDLLITRWPLPESRLALTIIVLLVTIVSLAFCAPLVQALNYLVPQLVGKPGVRGPLLPILDRRRKVA